MGRPKKVVKEDSVDGEEKVKIFSQRRGDVQLKDGVVVKFQEITEVSVEDAKMLLKAFPDEMRQL